MSLATLYKYVTGTYTTITDEQYTDFGTISQLGTVKRAFLETSFVIRTAAGGGGTLLTLNVDYEFYQKDAYYTTAESANVWTGIKILNVAYETGDLFITYRTIGSYTDPTTLVDHETRLLAAEASLTNILSSFDNQNFILNGGMSIAQRGVSFAAIATATYSLDRWKYLKAGAVVHTITRDTDVPGAAAPTIKFSLKLDVTTEDSALAASDYCAIAQNIEGYNFAQIVGKTMQLSFWVKGAKTGLHGVAIASSNGDRSYTMEYTINVADTWEYKTVTFICDVSSGTWVYTTGIGLQVIFALAIGSDFGSVTDTWGNGLYLAPYAAVNECDATANNFFITGVMLNVGTAAAPFKLAERTRPAEVLACLRYYEKSYGPDVYAGAADTVGQYITVDAAAAGKFTQYYKAQKRAIATPSIYSPASGTVAKYRDVTSGADFVPTVVAAGTKGFTLELATHGAAAEIISYQWVVDAEL